MAVSTTQSAPVSGRKKLSSAGASVSGTSWNSKVTPSITSVWPVSVTSLVTARSEGLPLETPFPIPTSTWPRGPRSRPAPYMYPARLAIAGPPITFSLTAAAVKPSGAQTGTCSSPITPATPPKWSIWLWV